MSVTKIEYVPKGVCCSKISIDIEDNNIVQASVVGGCNGNLKGICNLIKNKPYQEVIDALSGVVCNNKKTSCPDQIAKALQEHYN